MTPDSRRVLFVAPGDIGSGQLHSVPIAGGPAKKLTEHGVNRVYQVEISPVSSRVAYSLEGGDSVHSVFTVPVKGGEAVPVPGACCQVNLSPFSPDSRRFLLNELVTEELFSAPAAGGSSILLSTFPLYGVLITPDSGSVVCSDNLYSQDGGSLYTVPLLGGPPVRLNDTLVPGGGVRALSLSPDGTRVVYVADQDTDDVFELYSVPVHGGTVTKLTPTMVAGGTAGDAGNYIVSPDGTRLVYLADQDADQVYELFNVHLPGGLPTKLNGPLVRNGDVDSFAFTISPDSRHVVYVADQEVDGVQDLYSVPIDGGPAVKLNTQTVASWDFDVSPDSRWVVFRDQFASPLPALHAVPIEGGAPVELGGMLPAGTVVDVQISPDSSRAVIRHVEHTVPFADGIYSVPLAGGTPTKLTPAPVPNGRIFNSRIGPDGSTVFYAGDLDVDEVFELYSVPIGGGPSVKLNGPMVAGGDVLTHAFQLDSGHCVYLADQDTDGKVELYGVTLPGLVRTKLNPPLVAGGNVGSAAIAPDASRVVYRADQNVNEVFELFSVPIAGGPATRLNAPLVAGGDVNSSYFISPGSDRVVYFADQDVNDRNELYSVPIGGGPVAKLNAPLSPGGNVQATYNGLQFDSAAGRVLFLADQYTNDVTLFSAPLAGGAPTDRLSVRPVPNGDVSGGFYYSPFLLARGFVVYRADQDEDEVFELYLSFLSIPGRASDLPGPATVGPP